jgi:hypothetical protein
MTALAITMQMEAMRLLQAGFGPRFKTYRNTPALQVTPQDLPMLGVYILRERRVQSGHANHAIPDFQAELTLGFSGACQADTEDQNQLLVLEEMMTELDDMLLTNAVYVKRVEGFTGMDRQSQYAKVGETTLFEIRVEMQMTYRTWFNPVVVDDFNTMHLTLQYPPNVDPDSVLEIIRIYEINQNAFRQSKAGLNGGHRPHQP